MKKRKYIIIATSFVIAWILTATMGTSQLTKWQDERFLQKQKEEYVSRGKMIFSKRVDADIWNSPEPRPNRFYYYKNTSPFPFIINSEFGQNTGWAIHGNSTLWVWFLGAKFPIFTHRRMHGHSYKQVSTNTNTASNLSSTKTEPSETEMNAKITIIARLQQDGFLYKGKGLYSKDNISLKKLKTLLEIDDLKKFKRLSGASIGRPAHSFNKEGVIIVITPVEAFVDMLDETTRVNVIVNPRLNPKYLPSEEKADE